MPTATMTWDEAMRIWFALPKEEHLLLRRAAVRRMVDRGCEEIGTSDVNGEVFAIVTAGEVLEEIEGQREWEGLSWD